VLELKHEETEVMLEGKELREFMLNEFETEDMLALLATIRQQSQLSQSKKKDWNSRFGSGMKSNAPGS
jgi:hypothetical protein